MLIGIDCGCLGISKDSSRGGIYSIAKTLLLELGKIDKKNNYILYSFYPIDKKLMNEFGSRMINVVVRPARGWMKIWLPLRINKDKPDIFIGLSQSIPYRFPFIYYPKTIVFVYDIGFEKLPAMYLGFPKKLKVNSRYAVNNCMSIIATSISTKKDLIKIYGADPSKIKVLYPSVADMFNAKGKKFKNAKPYFLYVGALKKTKNIKGLIESFNNFSKKTKLKYELLIAGGGYLSSDASSVLKEKNIKNIKFLGFVKDDILAQLYRGATAFVSPSFYEGFGMPFLEAMKSGAPVIGSNKSSIPEIVGGAGILVDPNDFEKISSAMLSVTIDSKLKNKMTKEGIKASKKFTSLSFAKGVLSTINNI